MIVAGDLQRLAAVEQLRQITANMDVTQVIGQPVFTSGTAGQLSNTETTGSHMVGILVATDTILLKIGR